MSEDRKAIEKQIFRLSDAINVHAAYGSPAECNRLRDEIGKLERELDQINQREREERMR